MSDGVVVVQRQALSDLREQLQPALRRLDEMQARLEAQHHVQREALQDGTKDGESRERWLQCADTRPGTQDDSECAPSASNCSGPRPIGLCYADV